MNFTILNFMSVPVCGSPVQFCYDSLQNPYSDQSGFLCRGDTCAAALLQQFMKLADFVKQKGGVVALYDNEASNADSCPLHPLYWNLGFVSRIWTRCR